VLTKKSELNLRGIPTSLHRRILTIHVFLYYVKISLHKSRLIKPVVPNFFKLATPYREKYKVRGTQWLTHSYFL